MPQHLLKFAPWTGDNPVDDDQPSSFIFMRLWQALNFPLANVAENGKKDPAFTLRDLVRRFKQVSEQVDDVPVRNELREPMLRADGTPITRRERWLKREGGVVEVPNEDSFRMLRGIYQTYCENAGFDIEQKCAVYEFLADVAEVEIAAAAPKRPPPDSGPGVPGT